MNTRYSCSICSTKPDQLSHHKAHLQTQKHKENRDAYEKELKYFSIYKLIHPNEWLQHDEIKEMIFNEYGKELTKENIHDILIKKLNVIEKFIPFKPEKVFFHIIDGQPTNKYVEPYDVFKKEIGEIDINNKSLYLEWRIEKVLQSKETICENFSKIQDIQNKIRNMNSQRIQLNKYTIVDYNILYNIRMNEYDITYFTLNGSNSKPDLVYDNVFKYACVLFNEFGLTQSNHNEDVYFHKLAKIETNSVMVDVEGYEKKSVTFKKVWIKKLNCNNDTIYNDGVCTYVEDEVIKQKFRDYLIHFYIARKDKYKEAEKDIEVLSKMLFESELFKNIMKLCEFFFEYKIHF